MLGSVEEHVRGGDPGTWTPDHGVAQLSRHITRELYADTGGPALLFEFAEEVLDTEVAEGPRFELEGDAGRGVGEVDRERRPSVVAFDRQAAARDRGDEFEVLPVADDACGVATEDVELVLGGREDRGRVGSGRVGAVGVAAESVGDECGRGLARWSVFSWRCWSASVRVLILARSRNRRLPSTTAESTSTVMRRLRSHPVTRRRHRRRGRQRDVPSSVATERTGTAWTLGPRSQALPRDEAPR